MDWESFIRQVELMRGLQKTFFGTRPEHREPHLVRRAKAAEKAVDAAISGWKQGQGTLFGEASRCD